MRGKAFTEFTEHVGKEFSYKVKPHDCLNVIFRISKGVPIYYKYVELRGHDIWASLHTPVLLALCENFYLVTHH
jgi:hypothetical protein